MLKSSGVNKIIRKQQMQALAEGMGYSMVLARLTRS
jgi:hypothetical protein